MADDSILAARIVDRIDEKDPIMPTDILRYAFTVHDYARMLAAGIFHEDDRVELIDGEHR